MYTNGIHLYLRGTLPVYTCINPRRERVMTRMRVLVCVCVYPRERARWGCERVLPYMYIYYLVERGARMATRMRLPATRQTGYYAVPAVFSYDSRMTKFHDE